MQMQLDGDAFGFILPCEAPSWVLSPECWQPLSSCLLFCLEWRLSKLGLGFFLDLHSNIC